MADVDDQYSDEEVCEKVSDSDDDPDEYVFAPIGELLVSSIENFAIPNGEYYDYKTSKPVAGFSTIRVAKYLNILFIHFAFAPFKSSRYIYIIDKLGVVGTWIRHRLLVSILMGTPPLVAIQVQFYKLCSFRISRCFLMK